MVLIISIIRCYQIKHQYVMRAHWSENLMQMAENIRIPWYDFFLWVSFLLFPFFSIFPSCLTLFYLFIYLARLYHKMYCFLEKEHLQIHQIWQILKKHSFFNTKSSDDVLSALDLPFLLQWNFYETYFPTWGLKFVPFG